MQHAGLLKLSSVPCGSAASPHPKEVVESTAGGQKRLKMEKGQKEADKQTNKQTDGLQVVVCQADQYNAALVL